MKKGKAILFSAFTCLALFSCVACSTNAKGNSSTGSGNTNNPSDTEKPSNSTVPEYKGMTISQNSSRRVVNEKNVFKANSGTDNEAIDNQESATSEVPEYDDHEEKEDTIEENIEDLVSIDVETDDEVKYYVQPKETFTVEIHLSNPNQYEIQSFTLNGKKYSNYMFKDGSTMDLLLLETTAPSTPGYYEYTIDAIKYIDGTEIKDVKMSGDKTIKTGIEYSSAPTASISSLNISTTYVDMGIDIVDTYSLIGKNELFVYLSDGENIIDKKSLKVGINEITFENLEAHTLYEYGVITAFDLADGQDLHSEWLLTDTFTTKSIYSLSSIERTNTSISFKVDKNGEAGQIDSISLYDNSNGRLVASGNSSTRSFDGLLSNHTYKLYVDFSYMINDTKIADWVGEDITTIAKVDPKIEILDISADKTSVTYRINTEDVDDVCEIKEVDLVKNGEVIDSQLGSGSGSFTGLLSNNTYNIEVSYSYDLNDGNGRIDSKVSESFTTSAKFEPQIKIVDFSSDKTSVSYKIDIVDDDGIGKIDKVELVKDGDVVSTNNGNLEGTFNNLLSGNNYEIKVSYSYDLNDGKGIKVNSISQSISTIAKITPKVIISDFSAGQTSIDYQLDMSDEDEICTIEKVELLKNGEVVDSTDGSASGSFDNLLSNNTYSLKVIYSYDLNDGNGIVYSFIEENINTLAKNKPIIGIDTKFITDSSISADIVFEDVDSVGVINSVTLYKGNEVVAINSSKEVNFNDLDYYTDYKVVISYSYDLNDGKGMVKSQYEKSYKTSPYIGFNSCEIINTSAVSDGETIFMEASLDNPLGALPKSVVINGQTYNCSGSTSANLMYIEILYSGQFEGGETSLTIEKLTMVLDGDEYTIIPASNNVANVFINGEFIVDSFKIVNENGEEIQYCFPSEEAFIEINIDNKSGYKIDSFKLSTDMIPDNRYTIDMDNLMEISANTYRCRINFLEYGSSTFVFGLDSVSYYNDYISKTISTSFKTNKFFILQSDEIVEINNLDELMNTEYTYQTRYYKLMNDIDLSGIEWTSLPKFSGIFDGNGHEIKNMTNASTIYDKDVEIGLFEDIYSGQMAIFKDLSISNMKVLIDHRTSDPNNQYSLSIGAFVAGFGQGKYCYFENCSVKVDVSVNSSMTCNNSSYGLFIGGFIGCFTNGAEVSFNNCVSDVAISLRCPNSKDEKRGYVYYGILVGYIFPDYVKELSIVDSSITGIVNAEQYQNIANKCGLLFGFKDYDLGYWGDQGDLEIINSSLDLSQINGISYKGTENFKGTIKEYAKS